MLALYSAGEKYTSQDDLASRLGCAKSTVNKAIDKSSKLKGWMARYMKSSPKAQSRTDVVEDSTPSQREGDPSIESVSSDDVDKVMAQLIQQAEPEKRAELNELDDEQRRELVKACLEQQSDMHIEGKARKGNRILGRKP